jgi:ABC-type cobalamin/Fe3+-siderophores transport system ATPase subunit
VRLDIELKNYRCFPDTHPARFSIGRRFLGFIGTNNSGKSTLLRSFYELREFYGRFSSPRQNLLGYLMEQTTDRINFQGVVDQDEVFSNTNDRDIELRFTLDLADEQEPSLLPRPNLTTATRLAMRIERDTRNVSFKIEDPALPGPDVGWDESVLIHGGTPFLDFAPWFEIFRWLASALYIGPFRNAINTGGTTYYDLQVGTAFINQWDTYKSGPNRSQNRAALQLTQEIQRIFDLRSLDINASNDNETLLFTINGQPYRLEEVGGGLAHFVIVLAFGAIQRPPLILIDEPELNLHPSLQLDFLTTLATYARQGTLFSTHSIGLARAAGEIVYSVRRIEPGVSEIRELEGTPRLAEFLGELSLSGYQELGFDKVLLVEGPKDVTAVQRLLRLYGIEHKVVLLTLGGGSLINAQSESQLEEITRLTPNAFALIDSEKSSPGDELGRDRAEFVAACERVGITSHVLERRALENYFVDRAVKSVKGDKYRALGPFELLRDAEHPWGKDENWRIAGAMLREELEGTDLHAFFEKVKATPSQSP